MHDMLLNTLIHAVVSGQVFFIGALLLAFGGAVATRPVGQLRQWLRRIEAPAVLLGVALVALSSTPLPLLVYPCALVALVSYLVSCWGRAAHVRPRAGLVLAAAAVASVLAELPHHLRQPAPGRQQHEVFVLGDSISAGLGQPGVVPYPQLLHERHGIPVTNLAVSGCNVRGATVLAEKIHTPAGLVLLEIGGIDLLGKHATAALCRDLRSLLDRVATPERTVVMLELPLPPFMAGYGRVQRSLAKEYGAILAPKHVMAGVLCSPGATDPADHIHLTKSGQELMALRLWPWLRPSLVASGARPEGAGAAIAPGLRAPSLGNPALGQLPRFGRADPLHVFEDAQRSRSSATDTDSTLERPAARGVAATDRPQLSALPPSSPAPR